MSFLKLNASKSEAYWRSSLEICSFGDLRRPTAALPGLWLDEDNEGPRECDHNTEVGGVDDLIELAEEAKEVLPSEVGKWVWKPRWYLAMHWLPRTNLIWTIHTGWVQSPRQIVQGDVLLLTLYLYVSPVINDLMMMLSSLEGFMPHPALNEVSDLTWAKRTHTTFPLLSVKVAGKSTLAELGSECFANLFSMDGCVTATGDLRIGFRAFGVTKLRSWKQCFLAAVLEYK